MFGGFNSERASVFVTTFRTLWLCVICEKHLQQTPASRSDLGPCGAPSAPYVTGAACSDDPSFHSQSPRQKAESLVE